MREAHSVWTLVVSARRGRCHWRTNESLHYCWSTNTPVVRSVSLTHTDITHRVNETLTLIHIYIYVHYLDAQRLVLTSTRRLFNYPRWLNVFHFLDVYLSSTSVFVCLWIFGCECMIFFLLCVFLFWLPGTGRWTDPQILTNNKWKLFSGTYLLLLDSLSNELRVGPVCVCFHGRGRGNQPGLVCSFVLTDVYGTKQKDHREILCFCKKSLGVVEFVRHCVFTVPITQDKLAISLNSKLFKTFIPICFC